jgi:hypothetical protein
MPGECFGLFAQRSRDPTELFRAVATALSEACAESPAGSQIVVLDTPNIGSEAPARRSRSQRGRLLLRDSAAVKAPAGADNQPTPVCLVARSVALHGR